MEPEFTEAGLEVGCADAGLETGSMGACPTLGSTDRPGPCVNWSMGPQELAGSMKPQGSAWHWVCLELISIGADVLHKARHASLALEQA